jgi:hypothetical protein
VSRIGQSDVVVLLPAEGRTPEAGSGEVAECRRRPVDSEKYRHALELMSTSVTLDRGQFVCSDVDAAPQPMPTAGSAQVPDLGMSVPGALCVDGREHPVLAFGGGAQERVHTSSVEAGASRRRAPVDEAAWAAPQ